MVSFSLRRRICLPPPTGPRSGVLSFESIRHVEKIEESPCGQLCRWVAFLSKEVHTPAAPAQFILGSQGISGSRLASALFADFLG